MSQGFDSYLLRKTKAKIKFLSLESLIGPLPKLNLKKMDWVIVGGESERKPRPMNTDWVLDIQEQCEKADVAFFFSSGAELIRRRQAGYSRAARGMRCLNFRKCTVAGLISCMNEINPWSNFPILLLAVVFIILGIIMIANDLYGVGFHEQYNSYSANQALNLLDLFGRKNVG